MRSWIRSLFAAGPAVRPPARRFRPECQTLESRLVPALTGGEIDIDISATDTFEVASASSANGTKVAVWSEDVGDREIFAQRFDAFGVVAGPPINVSNTGLDEIDPDVAMDNNGNFVVVWTEISGDRSTRFKVFNALGAPTAAGPVATTSGVDEQFARVAMSGTGNWVCVFEVAGLSNGDIWARRFDLAGIKLGTDIAVATNEFIDETNPHIDANAAGRFAISFRQDNTANTAQTLQLRRYSGGGKLLQKVKIATDLFSSGTDNLGEHDVAMDNANNTRIVFEQGAITTGDIFTRTVSSLGVLSGLKVITNAAGDQGNPVVAMDRVTGQFVVAFDDGPTQNVLVREFNKKGVLQGVEQVTSNNNTDPTISIDGDGTYFLVYIDDDLVASNFDTIGQLGDLVP